MQSKVTEIVKGIALGKLLIAETLQKTANFLFETESALSNELLVITHHPQPSTSESEILFI